MTMYNCSSPNGRPPVPEWTGEQTLAQRHDHGGTATNHEILGGTHTHRMDMHDRAQMARVAAQDEHDGRNRGLHSACRGRVYISLIRIVRPRCSA